MNTSIGFECDGHAISKSFFFRTSFTAESDMKMCKKLQKRTFHDEYFFEQIIKRETLLFSHRSHEFSFSRANKKLGSFYFLRRPFTSVPFSFHFLLMFLHILHPTHDVNGDLKRRRIVELSLRSRQNKTFAIEVVVESM